MVFVKFLGYGSVVLLGGIILSTFMTTAFAKEKTPILYTGRAHRDPTLNPLLGKSVSQKTHAAPELVRLPYLTIQGVIWGGGTPQAIVDNRVVVKGDILPGGIEILDISGTGIKVLYRGKIFTLLPQGAVEEP